MTKGSKRSREQVAHIEGKKVFRFIYFPPSHPAVESHSRASPKPLQQRSNPLHTQTDIRLGIPKQALSATGITLRVISPSHQSTPPGNDLPPPPPRVLPLTLVASTAPFPPPLPAAPLQPSCGLAWRRSMNMGFRPSLSSCLKRSRGFSFRPRQRSWSPWTM